MEKNEVGERFHALAVGSENRPATARLRDIFDEVEVALKARVPQADVLQELEKIGLKMTIGSFKSALQRIRRERQKIKPEQPSRAVVDVFSSAERMPLTTLKNTIEEPALEEKTEKKQNPLRALSGTPKDENYIPKAKFELD